MVAAVALLACSVAELQIPLVLWGDLMSYRLDHQYKQHFYAVKDEENNNHIPGCTV